MTDFENCSPEDIGRKLLICADANVGPDNDLVREAGERLIDAKLYANGRITGMAVLKIAAARQALEYIVDWLSAPSGPDEAKCALARANEALRDLAPSEASTSQ